MKKLTEAKDLERTYEILGVEGTFSGIVYEPEFSLERRLMPRLLMSRYDSEQGKHVAIDPFSEENEIKVLSE